MPLKLIVRPEAEAEMMEAFDWYEAQLTGLGADLLLNIDAANSCGFGVVFTDVHIMN